MLMVLLSVHCCSVAAGASSPAAGSSPTTIDVARVAVEYRLSQNPSANESK